MSDNAHRTLPHVLRLKRLGIDTYQEPVIYMRSDCHVCRAERPLDLDSEGQLVASVLSKKAAAGSSHVVIDIPVGETAKVRSPEAAQALSHRLVETGRAIGLTVQTVVTDGTQPVGRGIGPALEARDVLAVLRREADAPADLRERALRLAGAVLEFAPGVAPGEGVHRARDILDEGLAWNKFEAICVAQGGLREPPVAAHTLAVTAARRGRVTAIDNRRLARVAKLAGAPRAPAAGLDLVPGEKAPRQKGVELIKRRRFQLDTPLAVQDAAILTEAIRLSAPSSLHLG